MYSKSQAGFTLIELIIVIVILGILASTAAPKFINLKSDAVISTLEAMQGSIKSSNSMIYAKAIITGENKKASGSIDINGKTVLTTDGYITATADNLMKTIDSSLETVAGNVEVINSDYGVLDIPGGNGISNVMIIPNGYSSTSNCSLYYNTTEGHAEPTFYQLQTSGC